MRVLEFDPRPERAAEWWVAIEQRLRQERSPAWALNVLGFLQGPDGAAARRDRDAAPDPGAAPESLLRPAVLATYASALLHVRLSKEIDGVWGEVAAKARQVPLPELARRLAIRARAGRVAACRFTGHMPKLSELELSSIEPTAVD